ncbi:hypothetical protein PVAND_004598 [Polypedilum vanderplanki]|uniref:Transmembrane protein n=1 Tax=Polypedilum vanderplanki TaxID=319348 RepID=A0A9J6BXL9_POLVA|nr:hypothetical protein PVAND_004598 [Polypedilum vanderplanki]
MRGFLLFIVVICLASTIAIAQWPNNNNGQQFLNIPNFNDICSQPGSNCVSQNTVCDSKGNCKTTTNGAAIVTNSFVAFIFCCSAAMTLIWRRFHI